MSSARRRPWARKTCCRAERVRKYLVAAARMCEVAAAAAARASAVLVSAEIPWCVAAKAVSTYCAEQRRRARGFVSVACNYSDERNRGSVTGKGRVRMHILLCVLCVVYACSCLLHACACMQSRLFALISM